MSKAENFLKFIQKDPISFQKKLQGVFQDKELKIKELKSLSDRIVLKDEHKIVLFISLKNACCEKISAEIYDSPDCFKRNIFGLTKLKKPNTFLYLPKFFGVISSFIIIREFLNGNQFYNLILEEKLSFRKLLEILIKLANFLSSLHSLETNFLPRFFYKDLNLEIEKKLFFWIIKDFPASLPQYRKRIERNFNLIIKGIKKIDRKNRISLIHGDFQLNNLILLGEKVFLTDFDTLQIGNPARDLAMFICHLEKAMKNNFSSVEIKKAKDLFLESYLRGCKLKLVPDFKTNFNLYYAMMIAHIDVSSFRLKIIKKISKKEAIKELDDVLIHQEKLLLNL